MNEMPMMDASRLLCELQGFVAAEPYLGELTAVQLSLQFLWGARKPFGGDVVAVVIETLRIDFDKMRPTDAGPRIGEWLDCFDGYHALHPLLRQINNGWGSRTLDGIVAYLARWSWRDAKTLWRTDGDKLRQYPGVSEAIYSRARLGCRAHGRTCCHQCPPPTSYEG